MTPGTRAILSRAIGPESGIVQGNRPVPRSAGMRADSW
jgi:hypothetical protein